MGVNPLHHVLHSAPSVMADCDGMSTTVSFRLCTYLIWSTTGIRMFRPWNGTENIQPVSPHASVQNSVWLLLLTGCSVLRYFPNLSTTHACCCGTKLMRVLARAPPRGAEEDSSATYSIQF